MKTRLALLVCIILITHISITAQVKIGDNATTINSASLLELETTNKGFVLPRVSLTNVSSSSPLAAGLLTGTVVYNTNSSTTGGSGIGIYYWDGSKWNFLANTAITSNYWSLTGNSSTSASSNFIGTTDAVDFVARTNNTERLRITSGGNVGIGLTNPTYKLSVLSASNPLYLSGVQATGTFSSDSVLTINAGVVKKAPYSALTGNFWSLTGNSGTSASSNFIGTSDAVDFVARTNNTERLRITSGGNVGIGLINPSYKLSVLSASDPLYLSGVQATSTLTSDSILTINAGVVKKAPYSALTGNFWSLTGNAGTSYSTNFLGTTDNVSLRFRTNNTERMVIDSIGSVSIGSNNFNPNIREKFLVDNSSNATNNIAAFKGNVNDYVQINVQNTNSGSNASSDVVATADDGTDSTYYIDMGINSSNYSSALDNWGGPHDGYLYSYSKNLLIGTQAFSSDIVFLSGGGRTKYNSVLRMDGATGNIVVGKGDNNNNATGNTIRAANGSGTNIAGGILTLQGGSASGTAAGGNLVLSGGTSASGTAGIVLFNTAATERMRIDATGNVGIGIANPTYKLSVLAASNPLYLSGVQATSTFTADSVLTINAGVVKKAPFSTLTGNFWSLTGNTGLSASTNFIGTTDATDVVVKTNNTERMHILGAASGSSQAGWTGMGITLPRSELDVTGNYANKNVITIQNTSSTGYTSVDMMDNSGNLKSTFGYGNSGTGAFFGSRAYFSTYGSDFVLTNNSSNSYNFFLDGTSGNVGINTSAPSEGLDVEDKNIIISNTNNTAGLLKFAEPSTSGSNYVAFRAPVASVNTTYTLPATDGSNGQFLSTNGSGTLGWSSALTSSTGWTTTGNSSTTAGTNFVGTTDAKDLVFKTNNTEEMRVKSGGGVAINLAAINTNNILAIKDGHIQLQQTTAPTIAPGATTVIGSTGSVSLSNATDNAGKITITTSGTAPNAAGTICTVTFNRAFNSASTPIIMLTATNANGATALFNDQIYVTVTSSNTFILSCVVKLQNSLSCNFNYMVVESQ